jgi:transposase
MTKVNSLSFAGQTLFCGIDVHKKGWHVNLRCNEFELEDFRQSPSDASLLKHLHRRYPEASFSVVYEAGFSGFSLQRTLAESGVTCMVVNPADVPTSDKDHKRKSDRIDARKLSRELSNGNLSGIYIPPVAMEHARTLVRQRTKLVRDQSRCKSRIWHMLMFSGLSLGVQEEQKYWSRKFVESLRQLPCGSTSLRQALDLALEEYLLVRRLLSQATKAVRTLGQEPAYAPMVRLLRSIPGIGLVNAMVILTEIQDMSRFSNLNKLCSYAGIVPDKSGSGERDTTKGITHRSNNYLRPSIVESSWVIIRKDPALLMAYKRYCKTMDPNKAIIKIARHLLNRIRFVMLKQQEYQVGVV